MPNSANNNEDAVGQSDPGSSCTVYVHGGVQADAITGAILCPIYQSATYVQPSVEEYMSKGFSYSRTSNPTVRALEKKITLLESGFDSCCFSTGMAATATVFSSFLKHGDHCIMPKCSYGGTYRLGNEFFRNLGVEFDFVDFRDPLLVKSKINAKTRMILVESPSNPTLHISDMEAINDIINQDWEQHKATHQQNGSCKSWAGHEGWPRRILYVADSTFATPMSMNPISYGVDIVLHSLTKFFDGHNQLTAGAVVSAHESLHQRVFYTRNILGNIISAPVAFSLLMSSQTLPLRFRTQCENAQFLAAYIESHPMVLQVTYPGLESFPQRKLANKLHKNGLHGSMIGFEVKGGTEAGRLLMKNIGPPFSLCENLGSVQSLITCPSVFTHAQMTSAQRMEIGLSDGFVRVSVGIEDKEDLRMALNIALDEVYEIYKGKI